MAPRPGFALRTYPIELPRKSDRIVFNVPQICTPKVTSKPQTHFLTPKRFVLVRKDATIFRLSHEYLLPAMRCSVRRVLQASETFPISPLPTSMSCRGG